MTNCYSRRGVNGASSRGRASPAALFLCVLALALALRLENARTGSLELDDFHTLHHARAGSAAEFFDVLARDNHPPLSFLLVMGSRAALGEGPFALRIPAFLAGLAALALVWQLGARLACPGGRVAATFLLAVSALHVELSTDVRMYALLALACAGLLHGLLRLLDEGRGAWTVTLWTVVGLHTHYHFLYSLAALGGTALVLAATRSAYRPHLRALLGAFAVAALVALPWYALVFPDQLCHGLPPGGSKASLLRLAEGFKNLVFLNVSVGGAALRAVGLAASAALLALFALGVATLVRRARATGSALPALVAAAALGVPLLTGAAAQLSERAGFEWGYLAGALPALCLAFGAEACATGPLARVRRAAVTVVGACALVLTALNARDPGEEDYRGAVDWITLRARPGDAIVVADWQPPLFPQGLGWEYYAARVPAGRHVPVRLAVTPAFFLERPAELAELARVFCCLRSVPNQSGLLRTLRAEFAHEEAHASGRSVYAHLFTRVPADPGR
jgi:4-amino-4-deoxy-L-arabinose transferase-like glycosyltransferase